MNGQERKDLERYIRNFCIKCVQVIVQSRHGVRSKSGHRVRPDLHKGSGNKDWFNLAIPDDEHITAEVKAALSTASRFLSKPLNICVYTTQSSYDGPPQSHHSPAHRPDSTMTGYASPPHLHPVGSPSTTPTVHRLPFEVWTISADQQRADPRVKVHYTAYNRLGVLLKSLYSLTRVLPAYRFCRGNARTALQEDLSAPRGFNGASGVDLITTSGGEGCTAAESNLFYEITCGDAPLDVVRGPPVSTTTSSLGGSLDGIGGGVPGGVAIAGVDSSSTSVPYRWHSIGNVRTPLGSVDVSVMYWRERDLVGLSPTVTPRAQQSLEMKVNYFEEVKASGGRKVKAAGEGKDEGEPSPDSQGQGRGIENSIERMPESEEEVDRRGERVPQKDNVPEKRVFRGMFDPGPPLPEFNFDYDSHTYEDDDTMPFADLMKLCPKWKNGSPEFYTPPLNEPEDANMVTQIDLDELLSDEDNIAEDFDMNMDPPAFVSKTDDSSSMSFFETFNGSGFHPPELPAFDTGETIGETLARVPERLAFFESKAKAFDEFIAKLN